MTINIHFNSAELDLVMVSESRQGEVSWRNKADKVPLSRLSGELQKMNFNEAVAYLFPEGGAKALFLGADPFDKRAVVRADAISFLTIKRRGKENVVFDVDIGIENRTSYKMQNLDKGSLDLFMGQVEQAKLPILKFDFENTELGTSYKTSVLYIDPLKMNLVVESDGGIIVKFGNCAGNVRLSEAEMQLIQIGDSQHSKNHGAAPQSIEAIDQDQADKLKGFFNCLSGAAPDLTEIPNSVNRFFIQPSAIDTFLAHETGREFIPCRLSIALKGRSKGEADDAYFQEEAHIKAAAELLIKQATTPSPKPWRSMGLDGISG